MTQQFDSMDERLWASLDGELDQAAVAQLQQALACDPALAQRLEALRRLRSAIRDLPREKLGEDFTDAVLKQAERMRLTRSERLTARRESAWPRVLAGAAVLLMAVGILGLAGAILFISSKPKAEVAGKAQVQQPYDHQKQSQPTGALTAVEAPRSAQPATNLSAPLAAALPAAPVADAVRSGASPLSDDERGQIQQLLTSNANAQGVATEATADQLVREVIYTDNTAQTQRELERALLINNAVPMENRRPEASPLAGAQVSNYFQNSLAASNRVQYVAVLPPEAAQDVHHRVQALQRRQVVAQVQSPAAPQQIFVAATSPASAPAAVAENVAGRAGVGAFQAAPVRPAPTAATAPAIERFQEQRRLAEAGRSQRRQSYTAVIIEVVAVPPPMPMSQPVQNRG